MKYFRFISRLGVAGLIVFFMTSCADEKNDASCTITLTEGALTVKQCWGYQDVDISVASAVAASCTAALMNSNDAVFSSSYCDATNSVGTCAVPASGNLPDTLVTFYTPYTSLLASVACVAAGGAWTAN